MVIFFGIPLSTKKSGQIIFSIFDVHEYPVTIKVSDSKVLTTVYINPDNCVSEGNIDVEKNEMFLMSFKFVGFFKIEKIFQKSETFILKGFFKQKYLNKKYLVLSSDLDSFQKMLVSINENSSFNKNDKNKNQKNTNYDLKNT